MWSQRTGTSARSKEWIIAAPLFSSKTTPRAKRKCKKQGAQVKRRSKTEAGQGQSKQQQVESQVLSSNFAELIS